MKYNTIYDDYSIGLGLFFKLRFGHPQHLQGWTSFSNIPAIDMKKLESKTKDDAISEVMSIIRSSLNFEDDV